MNEEDLEILKKCWVMTTDHVLDENNSKLKKVITKILNKESEKNIINYEAEYEKKLYQQRKEIEHEWQSKFQNELERASERIAKLETEIKFYKDIIKRVLHI